MSNEPIRILEVFGRMNRGGAEVMIMNLYRKMDRSRVQLDFMVHTEEHCLFDDEIRSLGGHIYRVPRFKVYNILAYRKAWRNFFKNHSEHTVVHGHMGFSAAIYLHEGNRAGRYTIAHSHSAGNGYRSFADVIYKFCAYPTRYVARQFFGCSTEAGISRYGRKKVHSSQYSNFPNAIDLDTFAFDRNVRQQKRHELGVSEHQPVIIHVGRVTLQKNPPMIYRTFKEIVKQNHNAVCLWVGTGEQEDSYRKAIAEEGLQERIRMMGVRIDIPSLLMAADSLLFPSLWEGLPVSVIEAQATGLPCVIANTISPEVAVSSLVEWHDLHESVGKWASCCLGQCRKGQIDRQSPKDEIRKAGYDILESAIRLQEIYMIGNESALIK
ncbi:MAG: glycosyltransferase [Prevotella sp.]|nr:glycosyltransferase [Prevotella sp.]